MDKIECPKCHHKFELTESLAGPLVAAARAEVEAEAERRFSVFRGSAETEARRSAAVAAAGELASLRAGLREQLDGNRELNERLRENDAKLAEAQAAQASAVRRERELDEQRRELELTVQRRVTEGAAAVRDEARRQAEEAIGLRVAEREATIEGEAAEAALEAALREAFPLDAVEPVAKGVQGADCALAVAGGAGKIIFESKRTKAWSDGWVAKLKDDQRAASADAAVIVTAALPKGLTDFGLYDGVWVTAPRHAVGLAAVLRASLADLSAARAAGEGLETKTGLVYAYLVGPRFRARVQAIVEAFSTMREDLDAERRAIGKQWAKREAQIERVLVGTVGMYGDLQAISGRSLAEVEGLDLGRLEGKS